MPCRRCMYIAVSGALVHAVRVKQQLGAGQGAGKRAAGIQRLSVGVRAAEEVERQAPKVSLMA